MCVNREKFICIALVWISILTACQGLNGGGDLNWYLIYSNRQNIMYGA